MCGRPLLLRANWLAGDKETKHFIESSVEMLWQSTQGDGTMFEDVEPHRPCMSLSCCITLDIKLLPVSSGKWIWTGILIIAFTQDRKAHLPTAVVVLEQQHSQGGQLLLSLPLQDLNDL